MLKYFTTIFMKLSKLLMIYLYELKNCEINRYISHIKILKHIASHCKTCRNYFLSFFGPKYLGI